jgi:hemolysin activation/secretion protein
MVMLLLLLSPAWAQEAQQEQQQQQQQQQRPTLGPAPSPSLHAPRSSTTLDARKLLRIRKLYIQEIDNSLSDRLIENLTKMGRFRIVSQAKEADATLSGSCLDSRRLKHVHSEISINDRSGNSIWQDTVYRPYNPPSLTKAVDETARVVATHLDESIQEAEHK